MLFDSVEIIADQVASCQTQIIIITCNNIHALCKVYGLKPEVWGRVVPDPRAQLQVNPARGPQAQGLGRPEVFSK